MKTKRWLIGGAWAVALLLIILTLLYRKATATARIDPSITNSGPTGAAVFADLLQKAGYKIRADGRRYPVFAPGEVPFTMSPNAPGLQFENLHPRSPLQFVVVWGSGTASGPAYQISAERPTVAIRNEAESNARAWNLTVDVPAQVLSYPNERSYWTSPNGDIVSLAATQSGVAVVLREPSPLLNRYIDRAENGAAMVALVRRFVPPGSTLVFCEHFLGNTEADSIFRGLGPWAQAAAWQAFFLFVVISWTFAIPFGRPLVQRLSERGARDLLEAMGTAMLRGKQLSTAQAFLQREADVRLRKLARTGRREDMAAVFKRLDAGIRAPYERAFLDPADKETRARVETFFQDLKELETRRSKRVSSNDA